MCSVRAIMLCCGHVEVSDVVTAASSPHTISDLAVLKSWTNWEISPKSSVESWSAGSPNFSCKKVTQRIMSNLDKELFVRQQNTFLNTNILEVIHSYIKKKKRPCAFNNSAELPTGGVTWVGTCCCGCQAARGLITSSLWWWSATLNTTFLWRPRDSNERYDDLLCIFV